MFNVTWQIKGIEVPHSLNTPYISHLQENSFTVQNLSKWMKQMVVVVARSNEHSGSDNISHSCYKDVFVCLLGLWFGYCIYTLLSCFTVHDRINVILSSSKYTVLFEIPPNYQYNLPLNVLNKFILCAS